MNGSGTGRTIARAAIMLLIAIAIAGAVLGLGVVHGVPAGVLRPVVEALGNAVVPQMAEWIGSRLLDGEVLSA